MNALFLSSHMYDDLVEMYRKNALSSKYAHYEELVNTKSCIIPSDSQEIRNSIKDYIFAFVYYFENKKTRSTGFYSPIEQKARLIKSVLEEDESLDIGVHTDVILHLLFDILFKKHTSPEIYLNGNIVYIISPTKYDNYIDKGYLEAFIMYITDDEGGNHAVVGFMCESLLYVYDSELDKVYLLENYKNDKAVITDYIYRIKTSNR